MWSQVEEFERLVEQYLASIPVPEDGEPEPVSLVDITPLPGSFPQGVTTEIVRCAASPHIQHAFSESIFIDAAYTGTELERYTRSQLQALMLTGSFITIGLTKTLITFLEIAGQATLMINLSMLCTMVAQNKQFSRLLGTVVVINVCPAAVQGAHDIIHGGDPHLLPVGISLKDAVSATLETNRCAPWL